MSLWRELLFTKLGCPNGYTSIDYIESTGCQSFNTGIIPDQNTDIEIEFSVPNVATMSYSNCIIGSVQNVASTTSDGFFISTYGGKPSSEVLNPQETNGGFITMGSYNLSGSLYLPLQSNQRAILKTRGKDVYFNNRKLNDVELDKIFNCTHPLTLFKKNNNNQDNLCEYGIKIYSIKIYQNNSIVFNGTPVLNLNTFETALFDRISSQILTSNSPTQCQGDYSRNLPTSLQQLEYLENTNIQYIKTGITDIDMLKVIFNDTEWTQYGWLVGNYADQNTVCYRIIFTNQDDGNYYVTINSNAGNSLSVNTLNGHGKWNSAKLWTENNNQYLQANNKSTLNKNCTITKTAQSEIYVFNRTGSVNLNQRRVKAKIRRLIFYKNGNIIMNLIPCLVKAGNSYINGNTLQQTVTLIDKPGFYDLISKRFFISQSQQEFSYKIL